MNKMPQTGIVTGVLLILLGVVGYFAGGKASITAMIPAFLGLPLLLSSLLALKPDKLKLGMHLAATFGLLGLLAPLGRIIPKAMKGEFVLNLATGSMITMAIICGIFVALCVKSFRDVRRTRA